MKLIFFINIVIVFFLFLSCQNKFKDKKDSYIVNKNYIGTNQINYIEYHTIVNKVSITDSIYFYSKNGELIQIKRYSNNIINNITYFKNNKKKLLYLFKDSIVYYYDSNGLIKRKLDKRNSTSTDYYPKSNNIEIYSKYNEKGTYYSNEYDSMGNLTKTFRELAESSIYSKDSIEIFYFTDNKNDNIENYTIILVQLESNLAKKTYLLKGKEPRIKLKFHNTSFIKTICDSIGCHSISYNFINDK